MTKKKYKDFQDFLNCELPKNGLTHWVVRYPRGCGFHEIGVKRMLDFVFFKWRRIEFGCRIILKEVVVANILQEPDSPIKGISANYLRIQVIAANENGHCRVLLQNLVKKFEKEFGMRGEIIGANNF